MYNARRWTFIVEERIFGVDWWLISVTELFKATIACYTWVMMEMWVGIVVAESQEGESWLRSNNTDVLLKLADALQVDLHEDMREPPQQ